MLGQGDSGALGPAQVTGVLALLQEWYPWLSVQDSRMHVPVRTLSGFECALTQRIPEGSRKCLSWLRYDRGDRRGDPHHDAVTKAETTSYTSHLSRGLAHAHTHTHSSRRPPTSTPPLPLSSHWLTPGSSSSARRPLGGPVLPVRRPFCAHLPAPLIGLRRANQALPSRHLPGD